MTENPYRLARDIRGIGFKTADAIAMKLGIEKTAIIRVRAGISYALTEAMDEGHCGLPTDELVPLAEKLLEVTQELIRTALSRELSPAASTSQKSSQQGFAPANRTAAHVALPIGVVADQPLIPFKLRLGNIALMVVLDQNLPIIPAAMQAASDPFASVLNLHARTAPAKCVGAGINRVCQNVVESAVHWRPPLD